MLTTIEDILSKADDLRHISASPKLDVEILLSHIIRQNRAYLYTHTDLALSLAQQEAFSALLSRRLTGEPVAYLIGHQGFWHVELAVDARVLIPRPETELLIEIALEFDRKQITTVADLGTGSGAIAIALAAERPEWQLTATDISQQALSVAKLNAQRNKVHIEFYQGSWFAALPATRFDMVISNPPYIDPTDPHLRDPALKFEPAGALVAQDLGLADLRELISGAGRHLNKGGWIILEHGYDQSGEVCAMLKDYGYTSIRARKDIAGNDRAAIAQATSNH